MSMVVPRPPLGVRAILATSVLVLAAVFVVYLGLGVSVSLIQANHNAKAVAVMVLYLGITLVGPVAVGLLRATGDHRVARAARMAALGSLAAQVVFVPVGLAVWSM